MGDQIWLLVEVKESFSKRSVKRLVCLLGALRGKWIMLNGIKIWVKIYFVEV